MGAIRHNISIRTKLEYYGESLILQTIFSLNLGVVTYPVDLTIAGTDLTIAGTIILGRDTTSSANWKSHANCLLGNRSFWSLACLNENLN
jgi:hypothetical protein